MVVEGSVAFSNLTKHDTYMGQSTGKFNVVLTLPEEAAEELRSKGIKVKEYEGNGQRKFSTGYSVNVIDAATGSAYVGEIPRGSIVRVKYKLGNEHPVHGVGTYLEAIKVLEEADQEVDNDF